MKANVIGSVPAGEDPDLFFDRDVPFGPNLCILKVAISRSPRVMGTTLRDLRMPDSRLIEAEGVQSCRSIFFPAESDCPAVSHFQFCWDRVMDEVTAQ